MSAMSSNENHDPGTDEDLTRACFEGDLDAIISLIEHHEASDDSYAAPISTIMSLVAYHHAHIVSWCLDHGATVTDSLMGTVIVGAFETHKVLIEAKAVDIDYYVPWFGTVLSVAATGGNYAWTKFCLENGADPNYDKPVDEYKSILAGAAENGKIDVLDLLLEYGAKLEGSGALVVAAEAGEVEAVKFLLKREDLEIDEMGVEHPTEPRETVEMGTALQKAAREGHLEIVELLVEKGASINLVDVQGRTALASATQNGHSEIAAFLWSRGAN